MSRFSIYVWKLLIRFIVAGISTLLCIQLHIVKPNECLGTHFYCDTIQCNSTALCLRLITSTSIISIVFCSEEMFSFSL